jgi:hypothetical protein
MEFVLVCFFGMLDESKDEKTDNLDNYYMKNFIFCMSPSIIMVVTGSLSFRGS